MGRKTICEKCNSIFEAKAVENMTACPVCGAHFDDFDNAEGDSPNDEKLGFGEDVELSENDSFDEDKIDFWWYSIKEPGEVWEGITFKYGDVSINCAKCGHFVGSAPYPIAREKDYLLIDSRFTDKCGHCGNELKNHILSKRPESWVDPRKRDMWVTDWDNQPKCPICNSVKIHKISLTNKAASALAFGLLAAGHVNKTYKCDTCGSEF